MHRRKYNSLGVEGLSVVRSRSHDTLSAPRNASLAPSPLVQPSNADHGQGSVESMLGASPLDMRRATSHKQPLLVGQPYLSMASRTSNAGRGEDSDAAKMESKRLSVDWLAFQPTGAGDPYWWVEEEQGLLQQVLDHDGTKTSKDMDGEDYASYVLALRCFLHPFLEEEVKPPSMVKKFLHNLSFGVVTDSKARKLSKADLKHLQEAIITQAEAESKVAAGDLVFANGLSLFAARMEEDGDMLIEKGKNTVDDFVAIFTDILRMEMRRQERKVDEDALQGRVNMFRANLKQDDTKSKYHARTRSDAGRAVPALAVQDAYNFADHHWKLAWAFGVSRQQHQETVAREQRINVDSVLADEFRQRLANLDCQPVYVADAFLGDAEAMARRKQQEEDEIHSLLRAVEPTARGKVSLTTSEAVQTMATSSDSTIADGTAGAKGGGLTIGVLKARNLQAKERGRLCNAYCIVDVGGEKRRTNTSWKTNNPIWKEGCPYEVKPKDEGKPVTVVVAVHNEEDDAGRTKLRSLLAKSERLGTLMLTVDPEDHMHPVDRWYALHRNGKRGCHVGDICLRIEYMSNRKKAETAREAKVQKEAELAKAAEEEKHQSEEASRRPSAPSPQNFHRMYNVLFEKVLAVDMGRYKLRRAQSPGCATSLLTHTTQRLLDEFGLRYGVGVVYRLVLLVSSVAQALQHGLDIEPYMAVTLQLPPGLQVKDVGFTTQEWDMLRDALGTVELLCIERLSHYKDFFPFAMPRGHLHLHIKALEHLYSLPDFMGTHPNGTTLNGVIQTCIETCCKTLYNRYYAMAMPFNVVPSTTDVVQQLRLLVDWVSKELDNDAIYFRHDFQDAEGEWVDVVVVAIPAYSKLLETDVECQLLEHFDNRFCKESLDVYHILQTFTDQCLALWAATDLPQEDFAGLKLWRVWGPHVGGWLPRLRDMVLGDLQLHHEKAQLPVDLSQIHKGMPKVLDPLLLTAEFLVSMEWPNEAEKNTALVELGKVLSDCCRAYITRLNKDIYSALVWTKKDQSNRFTLSPEVCLMLNDGEMLCLELQEMCSVLHLDHVFLQETDLHMSQSTLANSSGLEAEVMHIVTAVHHAQASMAGLLVTQVCKEITKALRALANEGGALSRTRRLLPASWSGNLEGDDTFKRQVEEMVVHLSQVADTLEQHTYDSVFAAVLMALWEDIMANTEGLVVAGKYTSNGLAWLDTALLELWRCLHREGRGLQEEVLSRPRVRTLREVLAALPNDDGERLVALHTICKDPKEAEFLVGVMQNNRARTVQDYLRVLK